MKNIFKLSALIAAMSLVTMPALANTSFGGGLQVNQDSEDFEGGAGLNVFAEKLYSGRTVCATR